MKPLLFIKAGHAIRGIPAELLDFEHWTRDAAGLTEQQLHSIAVIDGHKLPDAQSFSGVVISGSAAMVTDRHEWSEYTAGWLLGAIRQQVPILGICYGHQLLAQALGGVVDYHPRGREMGTKRIHKAPAAQHDELFRHLPDSFDAHVTHMQSVLRLPPGAEVLAWSPFEAHHAVRFAPRVWGVQFHPEFTGEAMSHYLRIRSEALAKEGQDPRQLLAEVVETGESALLLRRFAELVR